jgi:hypothetical protein
MEARSDPFASTETQLLWPPPSDDPVPPFPVTDEEREAIQSARLLSFTASPASPAVPFSLTLLEWKVEGDPGFTVQLSTDSNRWMVERSGSMSIILPTTMTVFVYASTRYLSRQLGSVVVNLDMSNCPAEEGVHEGYLRSVIAAMVETEVWNQGELKDPAATVAFSSGGISIEAVAYTVSGRPVNMKGSWTYRASEGRLTVQRLQADISYAVSTLQKVLALLRRQDLAADLRSRKAKVRDGFSKMAQWLAQELQGVVPPGYGIVGVKARDDGFKVRYCRLPYYIWTQPSSIEIP